MERIHTMDLVSRLYVKTLLIALEILDVEGV